MVFEDIAKHKKPLVKQRFGAAGKVYQVPEENQGRPVQVVHHPVKAVGTKVTGIMHKSFISPFIKNYPNQSQVQPNLFLMLQSQNTLVLSRYR